MVDLLTVYQFISRHIPGYDAEPALAAYPYRKGYILAWVHGPWIARCAEEPGELTRRQAKERGEALANKRGVRWLG